MANLLPNDTQLTLFAHFLRRISVVGTVLFVLVALVGIGSLVPGYLLLDAERQAIEHELEVLEGSGKASSDRELVSSVNKRLRILASLSEESSRLPEAIRTIVDIRVPGMSIRRIAYNSGFGAGTSTPSSLSISSVLRDRSDGVAYLARLREEDMFESAEIPLSSFTLREENAVNFTAQGTF